MAVPYVTEIDPAYGQVVELTPLVRRVVAKNPGKFTYTGTGTYIVGTGSVAVIDPGPRKQTHIDAILAAVAGEEVSHIVITHTHADHSPAAMPLQTATGAPIYGYGPHPTSDPEAEKAATPTTWDELMPTEEELAELKAEMAANADELDTHDQEEPGDVAFTPDIEVSHGDEIDGGNWTLQALHTPGHISNHLCYALQQEQALFTGDHVMGWSTSVVPPPDGSMSQYLASLELLLERSDEVYYPTHGPPITAPIPFARALLEHRHNREAQILDCLSSGPKTIPTMVTTMYTPTTPHVLHMAAGQSVLSHIFHLAEKGQIAAIDGPVTADATFQLIN